MTVSISTERFIWTVTDGMISNMTKIPNFNDVVDLLALLKIRNNGEARRHNEQLLAEHIAAGGEPGTAPTVDPDSVDWLTGKATRLDNGEEIQTKEGQELEKLDWNADGTTLQVISVISY